MDNLLGLKAVEQWSMLLKPEPLYFCVPGVVLGMGILLVLQRYTQASYTPWHALPTLHPVASSLSYSGTLKPPRCPSHSMPLPLHAPPSA